MRTWVQDVIVGGETHPHFNSAAFAKHINTLQHRKWKPQMKQIQPNPTIWKETEAAITRGPQNKKTGSDKIFAKAL